MSKAKWIVGAVLLAFVIFLVLANLEDSHFSLFPGVEVKMPLFMLVLVAYAGGAATAAIFLWFRSGKKKPEPAKSEPPV